MQKSKEENSNSWFNRFLTIIEKMGNKIPDPMIFFSYICIVIVLSSYILSMAGFSAIHPSTNKVITVYNLLSKDGILRMLTQATDNFIKFQPLGLVLMAMLGVGVCDKSGLFAATFKKMLSSNKTSDLKLIALFIFMSVMADMAGGTGFVVMPPLGAMLFSAMGRNPLVGALAGYASVSGAFASNLLVTSMDVLNASFTAPAAKLVDPNFTVNPAMNWYFSACSVLFLTVAAFYVTVKIVEPRLGVLKSDYVEHMPEVGEKETNALKWALATIIIFIGLIAIGTIPESGWLREPKTYSIISAKAPLMESLTFLIGLLFFLPGAVYGIKSGNFKSSKDVVKALGGAMSDMGSYIALIFMVAQFINYFNWSNIGIIIAIKGANWLKASGLPIELVLVIFVAFCSFINLLIASASSKWAIFSTIFVPMFMFLGYHPALVQMSYRIGDAITNPITPGFAYFAMLLTLLQKYDKSIGIGTLMANMLPYSISFFIFMIIQLLLWFTFNIPLGPGSPVRLG